MALRQTLQRNVFRKPVAGTPKGPTSGSGRVQEFRKTQGEPGDPLPDAEKVVPARIGPRVGRNDRCPCGSTKKYKRCCG
jgi:uncharacterized protein YecA (UPF0149 family)